MVLLLILLTGETLLRGDNFTTQNDSYFGYHRTKIYWTVGNGISGGFVNGAIRGVSGSVKNFETRIKGYTKPGNLFVKYVFLSINIGYNYYNDEINSNKTELITGYGIFGLGTEIFNDLILYGGGGVGVVNKVDRYNVNADDSGDIIVNYNLLNMMYVMNIGVEYYISKLISFYIDTKYFYNNIIDNSHFIPDKINDYHNWDGGAAKIDEGDSFEKKSIAFSEISFSIGFRFYWGQDMFWFGSFWEKN